MADRTNNRSNHYQHYFAELSCSPEMLAEHAEAEGMTSTVTSAKYNDELHDLKDQLKKEFWRLVNSELTDRQKEVINLYSQGFTQIEIAKQLGVNQSSITKSINGNCIIYSQNIDTEIGQIKIGKLYDIWAAKEKLPLVKTYNEKTEQFEYKEITYAWNRGKKEVIKITCGNSTIECTPDHKFLTNTGWLAAHELNSENYIKTTTGAINGDFVAVEKNEVVLVAKEVYDIEVKDNHNFIVDSLVAHNCDYRNGRKIYGGARKKLRKLAEKDERIIAIVARIYELQEEEGIF